MLNKRNQYKAYRKWLKIQLNKKITQLLLDGWKINCYGKGEKK